MIWELRAPTSPDDDTCFMHIFAEGNPESVEVAKLVIAKDDIDGATLAQVREVCDDWDGFPEHFVFLKGSSVILRQDEATTRAVPFLTKLIVREVEDEDATKMLNICIEGASDAIGPVEISGGRANCLDFQESSHGAHRQQALSESECADIPTDLIKLLLSFLEVCTSPDCGQSVPACGCGRTVRCAPHSYVCCAQCGDTLCTVCRVQCCCCRRNFCSSCAKSRLNHNTSNCICRAKCSRYLCERCHLCGSCGKESCILAIFLCEVCKRRMCCGGKCRFQCQQCGKIICRGCLNREKVCVVCEMKNKQIMMPEILRLPFGSDPFGF